MKINEVEARVGITKKNIRFYEEQGLIAPRRNSDNGYREYGEAEVTALEQIKLMRKLGVPLEEIRQMQSGGRTLGDGMRRHLITLERDARNLEQAMELCRALKDREERLEHLDAAALLEQMEGMEREGTTFLNKQKQDSRAGSYAATVTAALGMTVLFGGVMVLMAWAYSLDLPDNPPLPLMVLLMAIPAAALLGTYLALYQRLKEIKEGEADEARKY